MNTSRALKIWTIITHGLIVIGWGHGILFFFIVEIWYFPYFTNNFSLRISASFENNLPAVGFFTLLGQLGIVISCFIEKAVFRTTLHVAGILLLWTSIVYFIYGLGSDQYAHFAFVTAIPFAVCTFITFLGRVIRNGWRRILEAN